jgi:hypothetical protein
VEARVNRKRMHPTLTLSPAVDLVERTSWLRFRAKKSVRGWTAQLTEVQ